MIQTVEVDKFGGTSLSSAKLDRSALEVSIDFKLADKNLLITYHPVTLDNQTSRQQMSELLLALDKLENTNLIFTMPNADTDSRVLIEMINAYVEINSNAVAFTSLGQLRYLSCIKYVDGIIGNSSSGLIEVPSFAKGTINIGCRQKGRLKAKSVIDCNPEHESISAAIQQLYSSGFQASLKRVINPYGEGGASEKIVEVLQKQSFDNILKKRFHDIRC